MKLAYLKFFALTFVLISICTSCYRMPSEDDYSLLPSTNNPAMTRQRSEPLTPQVAY